MPANCQVMEEVRPTPEELERYRRQILLPGFGVEAQRRLRSASVLVVGSGGLGSPLLLYLTAAGVGHIGIVDDDRVELSNLHSQVLFGMGDLGKLKVEAAVERLKALDPDVRIDLYNVRLDDANAEGIIGGYDVVADGSDNFPTRYL
jgi:sulfur-carrier protein adenylyltransferase/sulfurtransferase